MVHIPVRKCWHTAKICFLLLLVVCLLSLFEQWRGGRRSAVALFSNTEEAEFEREIQEDEARIIPGLGEGGVAAHLLGEDKKKGAESEKQLAMNVYLSDRIAYNRTLKDHRNPACRRVIYDAELPSASVIIIFHNEPYSVVLRTVWSVLNSARRNQPWFKQANFKTSDTGATMRLGYKGQSQSSPFVYLKEIILVDDNSTLPELKGKLSYYVKSRLPPAMIRILRLPDRQGLMLARIRGARSARGDVLVFLDAHCEPSPDWLRPLLQRVKEKRDAVLTPIIDVIDQATFSLQAAEQFQVGGFIFTGHFTWIDVPEREKKRRGSNIAPTWSPTMAGGLFAINRDYYWELGAYDEQMGGWGGENLEMSFRIWQCGGTLETIPCSRVGHVFRAFHPYGMPASSDTHGINTARMAEVWMDEFAELFYIHRPDLRKNPKIGDVTHRKVLREKLQCKSFQWYLDNIYQEKFVPVRDVVAYGRFKNTGYNLCLDTLQREAPGAALGAYPCHARLVATQYFALSLAGQLRDEEKCAEVEHKGNEIEGHRVIMHNCRGESGKHAARNQKWSYSNGRLQHSATQLCLAAGAQAGSDVTARACDDSRDQLWEIDYTVDNDFKRDSDSASDEQIKRLNKLRGQRRISRSLMSVDDNRLDDQPASANNSQRRSHRKKHKKRTHKKKNKNKFILRIERTVAPPAGQQAQETATEHLEVDIRCTHRRLYPNNSFVRDLVSVLNLHDIKVINNGRVFERNRVSQLARDPKERLIKELELIQPPDQQQSPEPAEVKEVAPHMKRPRKRKRPAASPVPGAGGAGGPEGSRGSGGPEGLPSDASPPRAVQHKLIIEDFVEMPTTDASKPKQKQRNRMRKRNKHKKPLRADPNAAPPRAAPRDAPPVAPRDSAPRASPRDAPPDAPRDAPSPDVPQSARDALLALLGDKIDKATRQGKMDRQRPVTAAGGATDASAEDAPMTVTSDEHAAKGETDTEKRARLNELVVQPFRRDMPASASDEISRKQAQDLVKQYHEESQEEDNEGRQPSMRSKKKSRMQSSDETEKKKSSDEQNTREEQDGDKKRTKPVKVTMRNNFTFNIGDEFFAWRANNDDVADILGELAIPTNSSPAAPPIEAWVRPAGDLPGGDLPGGDLPGDDLPGGDLPAGRGLRDGSANDGTAVSDYSDDNLKILTGRGMLDDDDSNSASKSDSSGD